MKLPIKKRLVGVALAGAVGVMGLVATQSGATAEPTPKAPPAVAGAQAKPSVEAGKVDAKAGTSKGATKTIKVDAKSGKPAAGYLAGNVANVDFSTPLNYCQGALVYTPIVNTSATTRYYHVQLYANGITRDFYSSVAANSYSYPAWYGVTGTYYAYLYVWNGSSYVYDEYRTSANNCNVSVTLTTNTGYTGYVLLTIRNNGTAYASVESNELAPYPGSGTYTGRHWDSPAPNGGVVYRYKYVGTGLRYGIYVNLYGANGYSPWYWYGVL